MLPPSKDGNNNIVDYIGHDTFICLPHSHKKCNVDSDSSTLLAMAIGDIIPSISGNNNVDRDDDKDDTNNHGVMIKKLAPVVASFVMHVFQHLKKEPLS